MVHRLHAESLEPFDATHDIQDGVQCADFMQMHPLRRHAVHSTLSVAHQLERPYGALLHPVGYRRPLDEPDELADVAPVGLRGDVELDLFARNPGPSNVSDRNTNIADAEPTR
jgi:hypothetical protein